MNNTPINNQITTTKSCIGHVIPTSMSEANLQDEEQLKALSAYDGSKSHHPYYQDDRTTIYCGDNVSILKSIAQDSIDLTVTSPPYDNLRDYEGYSWDFERVATELSRVTKPGGVIVWVVSDATVNGSETGTSFKQALYFKECGFNLHDTMIWNKGSFSAVGSLINRYAPVFEYMFILSKGFPKSFNPIKDRANKSFGSKGYGTIRQKDGTTKPMSTIGNPTIAKYGQRFNIWDLPPEKSNKNRFHPAVFPEQLVKDHILSWSNEGDIVFDPFLGSGTTIKMAELTGRIGLGCEINQDYEPIIKKRSMQNIAKLDMFGLDKSISNREEKQ